MQINQEGINLIKRFEGLRLIPYLCPAGRWTIGYGHLIGDGKSRPIGDYTITIEQAEELLKRDMEIAGNAIKEYLKVPLTDNQFNAIISFVFNLGTGAFRTSTLLKLLNRSDFSSIPDQLKKWVHINGNINQGLINRRQAEIDLFMRA